MIQPPEGNLNDNMIENRGMERVKQARDTSVEGLPEEEGVDDADLEERIDKDPDEEPNQTDVEATDSKDTQDEPS
ncbi:hypothetical protein [Nocardioides terrisoli]|uniref:hypothetical protein n=1 Tax=Nocardioides terrisoli TaxID=3388267 RepID=UPI00287B9460|nr:hypothetical protein [Nocardioides marmorisolisilvae]